MTMTKDARFAFAVVADAAHHLAVAQHYGNLREAEEGIELAAAGISWLSRTPMADDAAVAVRRAHGWVTELSDDLGGGEVRRWDRDFEARCGALGVALVEILEPPKKKRQYKPRVSVPDGLLTLREAATRLACSIRTRGHVEAGALRYVVIGHGKKRPRMMFTNAVLNEFIDNQTRKDVPACPSSPTSARHTINTTSSSEVIAFTARPRPRPSGKPKK